ncbi:MAG: hypothetical protein R3F02_06495 [Thiolinea sp.]
MNNRKEALDALNRAWPAIVSDCLAVLGSELHYQAMIYHHLRTTGNLPHSQLGMNVKMWITDPVSDLFKLLDKKKHELYRGGFEPIPDVVIFKSEINGDWRRRNRENTLVQMLVAIEVKASERRDSRLQPGEIRTDILKLSAHREEVVHRGGEMFPIMMIIDSAHDPKERMTEYAVESSLKLATTHQVGFMYCSQVKVISTINEIL